MVVAILGALGYVIGHGPVGAKHKVLHAEITALESPVVAAVVALLAAMLGAWSIRRLWLEYLASWAIKIQVVDFSNPSELSGVEPTHLTTLFRNRLATLSLQSDSLAPGAPPPSDFLDVLGENPSGGSVTQVVSFVRATFPSTALVIGGTLLERDHGSMERFGISLQVTRRPDQGSLLEDVWDTSWRRAAQRAADAATAAILPRTRFCRGPWASWRGYVMPSELLSAYEEALTLESERRYYAALEACYRALHYDPLNRAVRLQLGKVQEQLGLFLDALGTYEDIVTAARPAGQSLPRGLYRRRARLERTRMEHIARYRLIVLLGGNSIVRQWEHVRARNNGRRRLDVEAFLLRICSTPKAARKARVVTERRIRVAFRSEIKCAKSANVVLTKAGREARKKAFRDAREKLEKELKKAKVAEEKPLSSLLLELSKDQVGADSTKRAIAKRENSRSQLRILLAKSAKEWVEDLCGDLRRWRLVHPRGKPHLLRATVALSGACIDERIDILEQNHGELSPVERLEMMKARVNSCARWSGLRSWQNHYNAACLYAIPLAEESSLDPRCRPPLVGRAIDHLALGASFADSAFLAGRQDWLISEDPDLVGLRHTPEFIRFVSTYFPSTIVRKNRPKRADDLAAARYMRELLRDVASGWATAWLQRSRTLESEYDWRDLLQWWRDEGAVWRSLNEVAKGAKQWEEYVSLDWRKHVKMVGSQRTWHAQHGVEFAGTRFLRYEEFPLRGPSGRRDVSLEETIAQIELRLQLMAEVIKAGNDPCPPAGALERPDVWRGLSSGDLRKMCQRRALLWEWLSRWLQSESIVEQELHENLLLAIRKVREQEPWWGNHAENNRYVIPVDWRRRLSSVFPSL